MTVFFYPRHILYIKASELAFEDCFYDKRWQDAIDYGKLCLNSYRKFTLGDQVLLLIYNKTSRSTINLESLNTSKKPSALMTGRRVGFNTQCARVARLELAGDQCEANMF